MLHLGAHAFAGELIAARDSYVQAGNKPFDTTGDLAAEKANFGSRPLLELKVNTGNGVGVSRKIYLGFDPGDLPRSANNLSLRLVLKEMNPGPGGDKVLTPQPLKVYLLRPDAKGGDWSEGSGKPGAKTEDGSATGSINWLNAPANVLKSGTDFASSEVIEAGALTLPLVMEKNVEFRIPLSPAAIESLRSGRHGSRCTFLIAGVEHNDDLIRFHSREATLSPYRPALVW